MGTDLRITDAAGDINVALSDIQVDTTSLSARIDSAVAQDYDRDSTNELNSYFVIDNDSLKLTDNGGLLGVSLDSIVREPWNTTTTTKGHASNTGDMYFLGNIAVGQDSVGVGNVASFNGSVEIKGTIKASEVNSTGLPTYADEAAASAGGLTTGDLYQNASGEIRIKL